MSSKNVMQCTDENELKEEIVFLEEKIARLEEIIAIMPGHVYWKNKEGLLLGCNNEQAYAAGLTSREDIVGLKPIDLIDKSLPEEERLKQAKAIEDIDRKVMDGNRTVTVEEVGMRADGSSGFFISKKTPIRDRYGKVIGLVGSTLEITAQKALEAKIKQQKEHADKESVRKSVFLTSIERMVRTVLSSSLGAAQLLARYRYPFKEASEILETMIIEPSQEIIPLIQRAHDYLKIQEDRQKGKRNEHVFETYEFFERIIGPFRENAQANGLEATLTYDEKLPGWAFGNEDAFEQILENILKNALKYTDEGRLDVSITVAADDKIQYELLIKIADTGCGIQPETKALLFNYLENEALRYGPDPFLRPPVFSEGGLNLSISAAMVEAMGGRIEVESELDQGTTFILHLPFKHAEPDFGSIGSYEQNEYKSSSEPKMIRSRDEKLLFLIVEDNVIASRALAMMIEKVYKNAEVKQVFTKADGLVAIAKQHYDLIFCDINLPDGNGLDVIRAEHKTRGNEASRCIVVTAYVGDGEGDEAGAAGAIDWVPKPIDMDTVIWMVDKYVLSDWDEQQ